jgi:hypothetical protein
MQDAIDQFRLNIGHVRNIHAIHGAFSSRITSALDLSDLLRSQIVMAVSALDHYVHEATRIGMLESLDGRRPQTPAFQRFAVSLDSALQIRTATSNIWLETEIRSRHGFLSFQQPDKIADAIRLISPIELWNEVGVSLNKPAADIKSKLQLIVDRRNKIAHEADIDPTYPGSGVRWPITASMVSDAANFIEEICETIHTRII